MDKKKPCMKFFWHGSNDFAHDSVGKPANVGHVCASTGAVLGSHMGAGKVHQWFLHLCWACEEIQLELVGIFNDPPSVHAHAVVMKLLKKQPNRPSRGGNSGLPRLVRRIARGRGR